jgi:cell division protein YceG involved in septum cleavage
VLIVRINKSEKELKSGRYNAEDVNSIFDVIDILKKGTLPKQVKVTIPEGFTVRDIAKRLYESEIS